MKSGWRNKENLLIALAWILVYASAPLYSWYMDVLNGLEFHFDKVLGTWTVITFFLVLYLIHHFIIVPKFFLKKRYVAYGVSLCLVISLFTSALICRTPRHFGPAENKERKHIPRHGDGRGMMQRDDGPRLSKKKLAPPDVARLVIALMMIGVDLGWVAWINSQKLRRRLLLLEKQSLKQELEHLRYQINPHFFMNTLNNIHVLVDVDQERAKQAIIELSKLMRHSLYNGCESLTALQNEIEFLRQYISLMQLRFGNRVTLLTYLPDAPFCDIMVPPLLFATFVENAFKHGISYQRPSFIHISLFVDDESKEIRLRCENSRNEASTTRDGYHGIGLNNVRKRLDLQYTDNYTLNINDEEPERFVVDLILPIQSLS